MSGSVSTARVAVLGHPFSFFWSMAAPVALSLLLLCSAALAAASSPYRLAGIVAVGEDYLGFLEVPEGGQILVRKGSGIAGGGRVIALERDRLTIAFPDRVIEVSLEGSGRPGTPAVVRDVLKGQEDFDNHMVRQVDNRLLRKALATGDSTASPGANAHTRQRTDAAADLGRRFASILNLPPSARLVAVNESPVTSVQSTLAMVDRLLAEGVSLRLNLAGSSSGDAETRVYLTPVP